MKILVTGSKGQLGSEIHKISANYNFEWIFTNRHSFNISDLDNIIFFLNKCKPEIIINCAAYTMVENAEDDFELADIINNKAVCLIAKWSNDNNCKLIHFSTDYIYDGNSLIPYVETDEKNPLNNYGKSKLLGDLACQKYNPFSIIIRTSWLYSSFGDNFLTNMIKVMQNSHKIEVVNDQVGSPTYAADLAQFILQIINTNIWKSGVYNYTNKGSISWYDFAKKIKSICNFKTIINSASSECFYQNVKRPKYSVLDNSKTINTFNIKQIDYVYSLKKCINIINNGS